jgi:hypothetical protein
MRCKPGHQIFYTQLVPRGSRKREEQHARDLPNGEWMESERESRVDVSAILPIREKSLMGRERERCLGQQSPNLATFDKGCDMGWVPRHPASCLIQYGLSRNLIPIELHVSIIVHWKRVTPVRCTHSTVVNALLLCSLTYLLETS